jgi:hypothetical protein
VSGLIPVLIIAVLTALILILGFRLLAQQGRKSQADVIKDAINIDDYSAARSSLDSLFEESAAMKRIFATDDMEFVSESATPAIQRMFLKERKRLAIQWLRRTQKKVAHLRDLHLKLGSYTYEPSPSLEFRFTIKYMSFVFVSNGLLVMLWLFGPFAAARIASHTVRAAEHFCSVFSIRLERVDPVKLSAAH